MFFIPYNQAILTAESQVDFSQNNEPLASDLKGYASSHNLFEVEDWNFDVEQTLNIGSQSSGAGAGKITFNAFSITRKIDLASPTFFQMACSGQAFQQVGLAFRKSAGGSATSGQVYLRFDFKLVAVKTIGWSHDDESPKETVTFEYGGLQVRYAQQAASGQLNAAIIGGWNRVKNISDQANIGASLIT
jgi:type VI secretion system Hcp family effector